MSDLAELMESTLMQFAKNHKIAVDDKDFVGVQETNVAAERFIMNMFAGKEPRKYWYSRYKSMRDEIKNGYYPIRQHEG